MRRNLNPLFAASICLLALAAFAISTSGQSGRKQKKPPPQPPVQGVNQPDARTVPEPEVSPDENNKKKEPQRAIMVWTEMPDIGISSYYPDIARQGCMEEFRRGMHGGVDISEGRDKHRSDAIKAAKDTDHAYLLYMEFRVDQMASNYGFDLRYTIFEPKTSKVVGTGSGYPQQPSGPISLPPIGGARTDYYIDWAGRDVARQVMKRLGWVM
jgi:hypothetical protein